MKDKVQFFHKKVFLFVRFCNIAFLIIKYILLKLL